jgi:predicted ATP-grasp superfamily ATP-dependent carboligase
MPEQRLIVIGASARAAAFSALRAGMQPWCIDLFADADLRAVCEVTRIDLRSYPNGFRKILRRAPPGPWIYTGGLENYPRLVDRIAAERPLWGNRAEVLRAVRDPIRMMHTLRAAGLTCPESRLAPPEPGWVGNWLEKPLAGAGGAGLRQWRRGDRPTRDKVTYQQYVVGTSVAATYAAIRGKSALLGVFRQLVGEPWLNAGRFNYCGSVGPCPPMSDDLWRQLQQIGEALVREFGLCGLFGVDIVLAQGEVAWPVEVNPRYTASMELLEHASDMRVLEFHRRAFEQSRSRSESHARPGVVGKAILFAKESFTFPPDGTWAESLRNRAQVHGLSAFADIPEAGTRIEAGWPVLTFFARGGTEADVIEQLRRTAAEVEKALGPGG